MIIRPATYEDIDEMVGLLSQLFSIEKDFSIDESRQRCGLKMLINASGATVLVAEYDARIAGMVSGQLVISTAEGGPALVIEDLVVAEARRSQGIGRALLGAVGDWGSERGVDRMQLLADRGNKAALYFYEQNGWNSTSLTCLRRYTFT